MTNAISVALALSFLAPAIPVAAQDWAAPAPGPIARSLSAEAVKLAEVQTKIDGDDAGWARVRQLGSGTEVLVLDKQGARIQSHFVEADDTALLMRDGALSTRINRADVVEIATVGNGKGSASAAAGLALAGGVAALLIDGGLMFASCDGSCAGNAAMMVGVTVGLPLAGGFGGYYGFRKPAQRLIYRAPSIE
jgi:hypothetical protein